MKKSITSFLLLFCLPLVAFAQDAIDVVDVVLEIINVIVPLLVSLALLFFLFGVAKFILASGTANPQARSEGMKVMVYGVIALFVMVSLWGLVAVLQETFLDSEQAEVISAPSV